MRTIRRSESKELFRVPSGRKPSTGCTVESGYGTRKRTRRPFLTFVTGCVLPADREKFLKMFDIVFPIDKLSELPDMILQYGVPTALSFCGRVHRSREPTSPSAVSFETGRSRPAGVRQGRRPAKELRNSGRWSPVMPPESRPMSRFRTDVTNSARSVPYPIPGAGRFPDRPEDILTEIRTLVESGCRSITLLGQNVNSYGLDKKGAELRFLG